MLCCCVLGLLSAQEKDQEEFRFGTTVVIPAGLQGQIYYIHRLSKELPNFEKKKPVGTIYTTSLNLPTQSFHAGFPGVTNRTEGFAIDYTGKFWIENPGRYRFILTSDDGSRLYIDDELLINNDGMHPTLTKDGTALLAAGIHRIRVSYFQGPGFEIALVLKVQPPDAPARVFSTNDFKPPSTVESLPAK
jgi:hypothetical protein